jgi:hypothetical protein
MSRDGANKLWTTYETDNEPNQLTGPHDIHLQWKWGFEVRFGRRFCCDQWAIEATYWTLDAFTGYVSASLSGGRTVSTPLHVSEVGLNGYPYGNPSDPPNTFNASDWFVGAAELRLWRRDEFQNVEISFIRNRLFSGCNSPWGVDWLLGARFFRFEEQLTFASLQDGCSWGQDGGSHEIWLHDQIVNNLWGLQFGFNADYRLDRNVRLFVTPKFGIYNNHINHSFRLNLGDGTVANTGTSGVPGTYPVESSTDKVSFLTQIDVGVDWQITQQLSARAGYRVLAATGIGLSDNQIPPYLVDIPAIADIETNGQLILHGAFFGVTYNY